MQDPVLLQDTFTYERQMIEAWLARGYDHSPMTGRTIPHPIIIISNTALKNAILDYSGGGSSSSASAASDPISNNNKDLQENKEMIDQALDKAEERLKAQGGKTPSPRATTAAARSGSGQLQDI